ncbi:hypothetical protein EW146_g603 [Bondarzewia mesenterica]|uniref:Uncharacterized protein n=1 Tax=Bondarzewia mesenterica TaxID=1095465 RepID=A0A4S4M7X4_9AGAM|nr:hypothetical protein EW146_g603 [Bondarzewia mesenterica]
MTSWTLKEVARHNTPSSCWVVINNKVYDVTNFLPEHPGGQQVILRHAGCDATNAYDPIHPLGTLEKYLPPAKHLGPLTAHDVELISEQAAGRTKSRDEERVEKAQLEKPALSRMLNVRDLENVARQVLPFKALSYYSSAADDEITYLENERAFSRFFFHPRVLRSVSRCDPSTTILGYRSSIPVFVCGAALARLGHPLGEINITRGAYSTGIIQMVSHNASFSSGQIAEARSSVEQTLFFQLYKRKNDHAAEERVKEVERQGYKAIFLTVDAIVAGNRERDIRAPYVLDDIESTGAEDKMAGEMSRKEQDDAKEEQEEADNFGGTAGLLLADHDVDMTWEKANHTLATKGHKAPYCFERRAMSRTAEAGVDGILLSNHGGRQLEYALPPIELLYRLRKQQPYIFHQLEVYIDGGIRRGTDVLKALCLGAKAVGMGRPFLYAQSAYGEAGVVKVVRILHREIVAGMRLLGAANVEELIPDMVRTLFSVPLFNMGFCRRCGDIVTGPKCKCGGTAVAPVVQWNNGASKNSITDRWSQTYTQEKPSARTRSATTDILPATTSTPPARRFPRPQSSIGSRISEHITSTTEPRPSSPLKHSSSFLDNPSSNILPSPYTSELSKVYGSVLQTKESLESYHCHICSAIFPPDATIYPDPTDVSGTRFMCRACFIINGGSRGDCPSCHRPVLILKSEGSFVENAGKVWHKKCFQCVGCGKNIGDNPMVDLLGHPSCGDCFDTCLNRTNDSPRRYDSPNRHDSLTAMDQKDEGDHLGGLKGGRNRESTPTIEELEQTLGIIKSRESTPIRESIRPRSNIGRSTPIKDFPSTTPVLSRYSDREEGSGIDLRRNITDSSPGSSSLSKSQQRVHATEDGNPVRRSYNRFKTPESDEGGVRSNNGSRRLSGSPKPTQEAIEEMKRRFLRQAGSPAPEREGIDYASSTLTSSIATVSPSSRKASPASRIPVRTPDSSDRPTLRSRSSASSLRQDAEFSESPVPFTPDLLSDFSDSNTQSSVSSSPPSYSPPSRRDADIVEPSKLPMFATKIPTHYTGETIKSTYSLSTAPTSVLAIQKGNASSGPASDAKCAKCALPLFSVNGGGRYVTVPEPSSTGAAPRTYHTDCFRCRICDGIFEEKEKGQAVFIRGVRGACHLDCAPAEKTTKRTHNTSTSYVPPAIIATAPPSSTTKALSTSTSSPYSSSRYTVPLPSASATSTSFPRFGSSTSCPGCHQSVSPMERGVVPGPQGSRWHAACLICGGQEAKGRGGRRKDNMPGCGKKLDSSAKRDTEEGGVWCRECLLLLPASLRSPQSSPTRATQLKPSHTGTSTVSTGPFGRIAPQHTGGTTIARQFTGLSGGYEGILSRQLTGGGLSPTRQLSSNPSKPIGRQLTGGSAAGGMIRARSKSVIGMRDEGRAVVKGSLRIIRAYDIVRFISLIVILSSFVLHPHLFYSSKLPVLQRRPGIGPLSFVHSQWALLPLLPGFLRSWGSLGFELSFDHRLVPRCPVMSVQSSVSWLLSLYTFPSTLRLSDSNAIDHILADIPVFSIGLLGFGTLTFFLAMKKIDWALLFLFTSVLLAFFAAILDLVQGLVRGRVSRKGLNVNSVVPFILAREVLFAVATSVRFLFFWVYVAQPPPGEFVTLTRENQRQSFLALGSNRQSMHSGAWSRWGVVGWILKWLLLPLSIAIGVLQILWRIVHAFHKVGVIYEVEGTMEITVSAIFIIKLMLNTLIASTPSRWKTLSRYSIMIFALLINMGIGIGNIIYFAFSESTAGRFLLAIEEYLIIVFLLISTSKNSAPPKERPPSESKRASSFQGLRIRSRESALAAIGADEDLAPPQPDQLARASHVSSASRLSSWLGTRAQGLAGRTRPALEHDEMRLWNEDEAERGFSPAISEKGATAISYEPSPVTEEAKQSARWQDPVYTTVMAESPWLAEKVSIKPTTTGQAQSSHVIDSTEDRPVIQPEDFAARPVSAVPSTIPSYYVREVASVSPLTVPNFPGQFAREGSTPSPIYGLTGTMRGGRFSPIVESRPFTEPDLSSTRSSGFEALLREQSELEKSIAALKLFAPGVDERDSQTPSSVDRNSAAVLVSRQALESASLKSDFSLSNFPQPPLARQSTQTIRQVSDTSSRSDGTTGVGRNSVIHPLTPPRIPVAIAESTTRQSLPESTRDSAETTTEISRSTRLDSGGTQYDVTSFIGGLTTDPRGPGHNRANSQLSPVRDSPSDSEPESASPATIVTVSRQVSNAQVAQTMVLPRSASRSPPAPQELDSSASPAADAGGFTADVADSSTMATSGDTVNNASSRGYTPSPTAQLTSPPTAYARVRGLRVGGRVGLPPRPNQWTISAPRAQIVEDSAFERPRPAPLMLQPTTSVYAGSANTEVIGGAR